MSIEIEKNNRIALKTLIAKEDLYLDFEERQITLIQNWVNKLISKVNLTRKTFDLKNKKILIFKRIHSYEKGTKMKLWVDVS